jgi:hypothetical protein
LCPSNSCTVLPLLMQQLHPLQVLRHITSLTCSSNLSFGFGMSPSRGPAALPLPIYEPIFIIHSYWQSLWQALFSPHDFFYYARYEAHYLLGGTYKLVRICFYYAHG